MRWFKRKSKPESISDPEPQIKRRIVATIGDTGVGKTTFLASMFWDSVRKLGKTLKDERRPYFISSVPGDKNEKIFEVFHENAKRLGKKLLPVTTAVLPGVPAPLRFNNVPNCHNLRTSIDLVFYDVSGDSFKTHEAIGRLAPFIARANDFIFLFDPTKEGFDPFDALELVDRIKNSAGSGQMKNFVVVLTKIDELFARDEWWKSIEREFPEQPPEALSPVGYFSHQSDPDQGAVDLWDYLQQMDALSKKLREWWEADNQEAAMVVSALGADAPEHVHFCAVSALGQQPVWDCRKCQTTNLDTLERCAQCHDARNAELRLADYPKPYRVRDPLFWIFREAGVM